MVNLPNFEVIVGTYEEYLLGYKLKSNNEKLELKQSFATHEHSSSLRTVTTCGKYVASGGADDRICIYDMIARKEHVMLTHHNSTINCLEFTCANTHIISSSIDGVLSITRVGNWVLEKIWEKAHKYGFVVAIAVHPTGKLALTLGSDSTLQTWNLIKGRKAYVINLNSKSADPRSLNFVKWGPCGENFLLGGGDNIEIWNITSGGILKTFNFKSKVICATWIEEELIIMGHENGKLTILNIETGSTKEIEAYSNRVKCLEYRNKFLVTASSSGSIKLWSFDGESFNEISQCNTGCRITCIALVDELKVKKVEKEDQNDETTSKTNPVSDVKNKISTHRRQGIIIEERSDDEQVMQKPIEIKKKTETITVSTDRKRKRHKKRKHSKQNETEQTNELNNKNETLNEENDEIKGKKKKNKIQKIGIDVSNNTNQKKLQNNGENIAKIKKRNKIKISQTWDVEDM